MSVCLSVYLFELYRLNLGATDVIFGTHISGTTARFKVQDQDHQCQKCKNSNFQVLLRKHCQSSQESRSRSQRSTPNVKVVGQCYRVRMH